jgi:capsular polysaccharide biosynthesis protein
MEEQGFVLFDGTGMSLRSQVALFSSASHLVGIHGAGLANIIWAPEGINVCEIFSSDYMPSCYSALTAIRNGCYTPVAYTSGSENMIDAATLERLTIMARRMPK